MRGEQGCVELRGDAARIAEVCKVGGKTVGDVYARSCEPATKKRSADSQPRLRKQVRMGFFRGGAPKACRRLCQRRELGRCSPKSAGYEDCVAGPGAAAGECAAGWS